MSFECCIPCKKPKRHPGCHDHCPEYAAARAKYDERKALADRMNAPGITAQKFDGVKRAFRRKGIK